MKRISRVIGSFTLLALAACGGSSDGSSSPGRRGMNRDSAGSAPAAVPVRVEVVSRRSISNNLHTNGVLEAEHEVDLVARMTGPVTELQVEEGDRVEAGQLLARIDDREAANQVALAQVSFDQARMAYERSRTSFEGGLVSQEAHDSAVSQLDSARAQLESAQLQLSFTEIRAPFDALVVHRHIRLAEHVNVGAALFRVSDFDPLLCPIQVPEKDLQRLRVGQTAVLEVEAFADESFKAKVQRIRPTVDSATGTVTVTLEAEARGKLRPGMFTSVFLEIDTHHDAVVISREALVLDAIGDTVFVRKNDVAERRDVQLGFREQDLVEVVQGIEAGEQLIVLGQDGLANGTPVEVLDEQLPAAAASAEVAGGPPPEQIEAMRQRMKDRGLSDEEVDQRLERLREGGPPPGGPGRRPGGPGMGDGIPPRMAERIKNATPEELDQVRERMRGFGMDDARIEEIIKQVRSGEGQ